MSLPSDHESDDDALSWGGESDSSHVEGPKAAKPARARRGKAGRPADADAASAVDVAVQDEIDDEPRPTSSALLVAYGIVAGVYALYTTGWIITILRSTGTMATLLGEIMYQFGEFLAIAASPLWFAATFFLTRGRRPVVRLLWLVAGLVLLVPVPFVLGA